MRRSRLSFKITLLLAVKTEREDVNDSESLPEDENDLITLSPSSSRSSLSDDQDQASPSHNNSSPNHNNLSRILSRNDDSVSPRSPAPGYVSDDNYRGMDDFSLGDAAGGDDKSGRKYCVREGDNVFRCLLCNKTYTHISNFCRHYMTTHTNKKQVSPCPLCKKPFTRRDNMLVHMKTVHRYDMGANNVPVPE